MRLSDGPWFWVSSFGGEGRAERGTLAPRCCFWMFFFFKKKVLPLKNGDKTCQHSESTYSISQLMVKIVGLVCEFGFGLVLSTPRISNHRAANHQLAISWISFGTKTYTFASPENRTTSPGLRPVPDGPEILVTNKRHDVKNHLPRFFGLWKTVERLNG